MKKELMKRARALLLMLLVASPVLARVISYAPYSNRISRSAHHERASRWFLLIEETPAGNGEVVLYDSAGRNEPRVVYPASGLAFIEYAALYEPKATPGAPPMLLVNDALSIDGGATWRSTEWLQQPEARDFDTGGPEVHGLSSSILLGTDEFPFIVGSFYNEIWAIRATGAAVKLHGSAVLVGRNAAGNRFLVHQRQQYGSARTNEIQTLDLEGNTSFIATAEWWENYSGWLTSDGSAYLLASCFDGRYLSFHRQGQRQFVAGPYGQGPSFESDGTEFPGMRSFAVPTHDYNGAWIIQRGEWQPTTLSRHTLERGLEKMWSDPSGPQVEALIAGASGETVLLQVHRDRPMPEAGEQVRYTTDPALAVWRVGDPMPADYDELFLGEQWNKGFIHVDVDRMDAGEPFVFNSGVLDPEDPEVIFSAGGGGGGDVIQEWGAVQASLREHLVLPGVARTRGAFGSHWFTDVTIYNPFDAPQQLELRFAGIGEEDVAAPLPGRTMTLTLAPREIRILEDVLQHFGVENGGGTLHILPVKTVNVTSRTYSRSTSGTFGFGMAAIDFFNAMGPRFPLTFAGAFPGEQFRTNILLTDTSGRGAEAELHAHRGSSVIAATSVIAAPASGTGQLNSVAFVPSGPGSASLSSGALVLRTTRGTTIPMVVAIDNRTNDPTYLPPDLGTDVPRIIPAIGHLEGAHGSRFRSDVYLFNAESSARTVVLEAVAWDGSGKRRVTFNLPPNESRVIPDALMTLFGMTGIARLRFESTGSSGQQGGVRVTSRTYNLEDDGATFGCLIPPLNGFQSASSDERLEIITAVGAGFRTNLAVVDLNPTAGSFGAHVRIEIFDETGRLLTSLFRDVRPGGGTPINDLFGIGGVAPPRAARIVIDVIYGSAVAAYATVTDNATNDTTYLAGQLGARSN